MRNTRQSTNVLVHTPCILPLSDRLYKTQAVELGFEEFHLFLHPVQFEFAVQKDQAEQRPVFLTSLLHDPSSVDS